MKQKSENIQFISSATYNVVSEKENAKGGMLMRKENLGYMVCKKVLEKMLSKSMISKEEFDKIDEQIKLKFNNI